MAGRLRRGGAGARREGFLRSIPEHSASSRCLAARAGRVHRILLTPPGSVPKRQAGLSDRHRWRRAQAPDVEDGAKITIDSPPHEQGTESHRARWLFDVTSDQFNRRAPQSIVSLDGGNHRQGVSPSWAWRTWACRSSTRSVSGNGGRCDRPLDLVRAGQLTFTTSTSTSSRVSDRAHRVESASSAPVVLNAANEVAVAAFLDGASLQRDRRAHRGGAQRLAAATSAHRCCMAVDADTRRSVQRAIDLVTERAPRDHRPLSSSSSAFSS